MSTVTIAPGSTAPTTLTVTFLACSAAVLDPVAAGALHEDLCAPPDPRPARGQRLLLRELDQALHPLPARVGRHLVRQIGGSSALTRREHERERRVEGSFAHEGERVVEVALGLAGKAGDEVGRDADVGHGGAQGADAIQVPGGCVASPHPVEHAVRARLGREVHVLAHAGQLGDGRDEVVAGGTFGV